MSILSWVTSIFGTGKVSGKRRPTRGKQPNHARRPRQRRALQVERRSQGSRGLLQARWWLEGRQERRLPAAERLLRAQAVRRLRHGRHLSKPG